MNDILDTGDTERSEVFGDNAVVGKWDSSSVNLTMSSGIDHVVDGCSRWESVGDEWFNHLKHVPGGFVKLDEDSVMDLSQSKELHDLLWLWGKLSDTKIQKTRG